MSPIEKIIATLFVVLLCPLQEALASFEQCKEATFSIPNRVLVGHALLTKPSPSIGDCMISCIERDPLCESINYYRKTKICELNDKNINSNSEDMVDFEWAIYMTNSERVPPCNLDDECGRQTDICRHLKTGGNNCKGKNTSVYFFFGCYLLLRCLAFSLDTHSVSIKMLFIRGTVLANA